MKEVFCPEATITILNLLCDSCRVNSPKPDRDEYERRVCLAKEQFRMRQLEQNFPLVKQVKDQGSDDAAAGEGFDKESVMTNREKRVLRIEQQLLPPKPRRLRYRSEEIDSDREGVIALTVLLEESFDDGKTWEKVDRSQETHHSRVGAVWG